MPDQEVTTRVGCPHCRSRLDVRETPSGARTVSVALLGDAVEHHALALEGFHGPDDHDTRCPACAGQFDPSEPYRALTPLNRRSLT